GQGGTDTLNQNDQSDDTPGNTYGIGSGTFSETGSQSISYSNCEGLALNTSSGANVVNLNSDAAGTPVTLNGGNGNDLFNLGIGSLDALPAAVSVNGGGGTDVVHVYDQLNSFSDTYTITNTSLTRVVFGGLTYSSVEDLIVEAEAGNNTININST